MKLSTGQRSEFIDVAGVAQGTVEKLDIYAGMLAEWSTKFNLVAPSTLPNIWSRHFLDSAQLIKLMPPAIVGAEHGSGLALADLGAGAGFPGLVLSIMGINNIHLIESTGKKADFLRAVIERLSLNAVVHNKRIEQMEGFKADLVMARALAVLNDLLGLATPILKKNGICLFLKGQKTDTELTESQKCWMFEFEKIQSISDPTGSVLVIRNLKHAHRPSKLSRKSS